MLEDIHDHEQNGVAVVESWRMNELEEELRKWGAWFSLSTRRKRHGKQCIKKPIKRKNKSYGVRKHRAREGAVIISRHEQCRAGMNKHHAWRHA